MVKGRVGSDTPPGALMLPLRRPPRMILPAWMSASYHGLGGEGYLTLNRDLPLELPIDPE
jgi:hypothetical protein